MANWVPLDRGVDGLEVLEDGTLKLSALRAQQRTYVVKYVADTSGHIESIKQNQIRVTLSVPLDHTVTAAYKLPCDPSALPTGPTRSNVEELEPGFLRQHYTQAGQTYKKWLRKDSYPIPESLYTSAGGHYEKFPDKLGTGGNGGLALRDDTEYLRSQAQRRLLEVGRIGGERSIYLKGIVLTWNPGDFVQSIGGAHVQKAVRDVIYHVGEGVQMTELVLN